MTRQFVLIDAVPGREQAVFDSVAKVPHVIARRLLRQKVQNSDLLVLVEAPDADAVDNVLNGELKALGGVHNLRRVSDEEKGKPPLSALVTEVEAEVGPER